jgi:adenylate kinase
MSFKTIYLTGTPATGKSTLCEELSKYAEIEIFEYGERLIQHLQERGSGRIPHSEIRRRSSNVVTQDDIKSLDAKLIQQANSWKGKAHFVINSHPVTKETYGFRITPFAFSHLKALNIDLIFVLYAHPDVVRDRISANPSGRPLISSFEAAMHLELQASTAIMYSTILGCPIYFLDSNRPAIDIANELLKRVL